MGITAIIMLRVGENHSVHWPVEYKPNNKNLPILFDTSSNKILEAPSSHNLSVLLIAV